MQIRGRQPRITLRAQPRGAPPGASCTCFDPKERRHRERLWRRSPLVRTTRPRGIEGCLGFRGMLGEASSLAKGLLAPVMTVVAKELGISLSQQVVQLSLYWGKKSAHQMPPRREPQDERTAPCESAAGARHEGDFGVRHDGHIAPTRHCRTAHEGTSNSFADFAAEIPAPGTESPASVREHEPQK